MQTGSPAQKGKRKVTGEIKKKKNSPPQVSQKTEESEDSGEDSGEDIADDSESSSSSSVLQKQETSKQKSQMKNISLASARKNSVDMERGSPAQKSIRKVTGVMQQKNISPASKKTLVETLRGSPTQKILPTSSMSRAKEAQPSSLVAVGEQVTTTNLEPLTNVDHILPCSDQEILNRLLATLSSGGAMQPTHEQMQSAYRLIANMGTMGLLQQFGPTPNPTAEKQPLEGQRQQTIEVAKVGNLSPEKEIGSNEDDDVVEDEEIEEESTTDDQDYVEEHDETSDVFDEVKEKKKGKLQLYLRISFYDTKLNKSLFFLFLYAIGNSKTSYVLTPEKKLKATDKHGARAIIGERVNEDEEVSENSNDVYNNRRTFNI
jgi:hypothetical protein